MCKCSLYEQVSILTRHDYYSWNSKKICSVSPQGEAFLALNILSAVQLQGSAFPTELVWPTCTVCLLRLPSNSSILHLFSPDLFCFILYITCWGSQVSSRSLILSSRDWMKAPLENVFTPLSSHGKILFPCTFQSKNLSLHSCWADPKHLTTGSYSTILPFRVMVWFGEHLPWKICFNFVLHESVP